MEDILNKESSITPTQSKQGAAEKQNIALTIEQAHCRNRSRHSRFNQNISWTQKLTEKSQIERAGKENIVSANEEGKEEAKWQWEGDLNATIQNVWEDQVLIHF